MRQQIPLVEQTYDVILPSGRQNKVNIFDMNLAMACGGERYIQLEDTTWIKPKSLKIVADIPGRMSRKGEER